MLYQDNTLLGKPISRLSFGGAALSGEGGGYGFGAMDETSAEKLLKEAWELGINIFDTAPIYGFGLSEERMGRYLSKEAIVVSKAGVDWHDNQRVNMSNDPKIVEKMLRASLKRLKREMIDVFMIHWPDAKVDIRRPMEVLQSYKEKGVINHLGLCNTHLQDLKLAQEIGKIDVLQSELNVLNTKAFDQLGEEWKSYFTMSWGTFDKGILTGRVNEKRTFDKDDARSWAPWWNKKEVKEKIVRVEKLQSILQDYGISLPEFCLNFNLRYYGISTSLVGVKNSHDLQVAINSHGKHIPIKTREEILERFRH